MMPEATTADTLNIIDDWAASGSDAAEMPEKVPETKDEKGKSTGRWRGLSAIRAQTSMQDKLLEK